MSLRRKDEDSVVVQPLTREGPDLPPSASDYQDTADGETYLFIVEDDRCDGWLACTESMNLGDCE